jgi:ATP-binding cassette subfamily B protein
MMYELLDQPETLAEAADARPLPEGPGTVRLEGVRFGYDTGRPVLDGLTLEFPAGQTTALVGPSGSGKSTVLNLILRLYDPEAGRVTIDGADIRGASLASLRRRIAFVGQDTFLFSAPVGENIRIGRPGATDAEVEAAARLAHAHEFIATLPAGYATEVGENGAFLSGGQRQRIAIARAVLRAAPILLLDEATSALDADSEELVRDAIERVSRGVTTIVIAHRLSTVLGADRICYLEGGRLVEEGGVQELLARGGRFRALFDRQFGAAERLGLG